VTRGQRPVRVLIAATDFLAHIDWGGLFATAHLLHTLGHEVRWCSGPRVCRRVAQSDMHADEIPVVDPYRGRREAPPLGRLRDRSMPVALWRLAFRGMATGSEDFARQYALLFRIVVQSWLQDGAIEQSCQAVGQAIDRWRPDVVIVEPMMLPGAIAAAVRDVPLVSCGYPGPFLRLPRLAELEAAHAGIARVIERLSDGRALRHVLPDDLFFCSHDLQLVFFPSDWFGSLAATSSRQALFVGGLPTAPRQPDGPAADPPRVVIAVSTSYTPDVPTLRAVCQAVGEVGAVGVIGGTAANQAMDGQWPRHISWQPWVDYDVELPRAGAIVHHGGLGTTHAAVRAGVPQLVLPEAADQVVHADAVARTGVGMVDIGDTNASTLSATLATLLSSERHRAQAGDLAMRFAGLGGVPRAADAIVGLARNCR
jgi:UDP:flavonoid glycosyltransferase YjiC (YdhE family)